MIILIVYLLLLGGSWLSESTKLSWKLSRFLKRKERLDHERGFHSGYEGGRNDDRESTGFLY